MKLHRGQRIQSGKESYEISRRLHTGGIAETYLAQVVGKDQWVAVKIPAQDNDPRVEARHGERLAREAIILRMIKHKCVVELHDNFDLNGIPILVEEYVLGGRMLETYIGNPANLHEACIIMRCLIDAVETLHQRGIIHRDLSPKNIIMESKRGPVIVDFNICLFSDERCNRAGTEFWSAPEHLDLTFDTPVASFKSDVYSLASIFLFLLTGQEPDRYYPSDRNLNFVRSKLNSLSLPIEVSNTVCEALSFDPDKRTSLNELREAVALSPNRQPIEKPKIRISLDNRTYEFLLNSLRIDIGREHYCRKCEGKNMVYVKDPFPYLEKHHIRLIGNEGGEVIMEVLPGKNSVAISRNNGRSFHQIKSGVSAKLNDMDIVVLAYSERRGPYKTLSLRKVLS